MKLIAFFLYFYMTLAVSLSSLEGITEEKRNVGCAIGGALIVAGVGLCIYGAIKREEFGDFNFAEHKGSLIMTPQASVSLVEKWVPAYNHTLTTLLDVLQQQALEKDEAVIFTESSDETRVVQSALETFSVSKDTLSKRALGHSETSFQLEERSDACVMATGVALCAIGAGLCLKLC
ncbi:hypothetical protein OXX59_001517 [Metschnikowia pulcherrima]